MLKDVVVVRSVGLGSIADAALVMKNMFLEQHFLLPASVWSGVRYQLHWAAIFDRIFQVLSQLEFRTRVFCVE